jgi:hypothetical protein
MRTYHCLECTRVAPAYRTAGRGYFVHDVAAVSGAGAQSANLPPVLPVKPYSGCTRRQVNPCGREGIKSASSTTAC